MPVAARDTKARHGEEESVKSSGLHAEKVPSRIMSGASLGDLAVGARLAGVDHVGKLNGILDKEDGNVVSNEIPVSFIGVANDQRIVLVRPCYAQDPGWRFQLRRHTIASQNRGHRERYQGCPSIQGQSRSARKQESPCPRNSRRRRQ